MNTTNRSFGPAALAGALLVALTGCTTYVERPVTRTVYVAPAPVEPPPPPVYTPAPAPAVVVIQTENDFYEPLSPYGDWVVVASYGRCWRPAHVEASWRPYANGYWRRTDAGWYWASDEPWGWATYHYGRWDWTAQFGWIWVPQTQWAPAWVSWREGAGYVGWAPLPPAARISVSGTVEFGDAIIGSRFVFVEERHLLEPVRPTTVVVNNTTVINKTVNITKIKVVNKTVVNEGPRADVVERVSGRRIETVPARDLRHREETEVVARRRTNPPVGDNRSVPPPVRSEPAPGRAVLPRESGVADRPVTTVQQPPAATPDATTREIGRQNPPMQRERPEASKPARIERKPETLPVAAKPEVKPEVKPEPKSAPRRETPARSVRAVEPSVAAQPPARAATPEVRREPQPAVLPREAQRGERANRAETVRGEASRRASPQAADTPAVTRVRSPKAAAAAAEQGSKKKDQKKKGEQPDRTFSPLPGQ